MAHKDFRRFACEATGCTEYHDVAFIGESKAFREIPPDMPTDWAYYGHGGASAIYLCPTHRAEVERVIRPDEWIASAPTQGPYR